MYDSDMLNRINIWRRKMLDGSITLDETKEAIVALRGARTKAAVEEKPARKAKGKSADELLGELGV